jgi:hypothetical protein
MSKQRVLVCGLFVLIGIAGMTSASGPQGGGSAAADSSKPIYLDTSYSFEERAADLVSRMTLEEKQSQLGNTMPAIPRLGVNAYNVWGEALHGVVTFFDPSGNGATSFPNSVAVGASWDPALVEREATAISTEARGINSGVIQNLTYWSPVVEPMRDPRWGRNGRRRPPSRWAATTSTSAAAAKSCPERVEHAPCLSSRPGFGSRTCLVLGPAPRTQAASGRFRCSLVVAPRFRVPVQSRGHCLADRSRGHCFADL